MVPTPNELCGISGLGLVPHQEIRRNKLHPKPGSSCFEVLTHRSHQHRTFLGLCLCGSSKSCRLHKVLYLCHMQSNGQYLQAFSDALQSLQNNPDVQACMPFDAVCDQNFQSQVQNIQSPLDACPALRDYLNCFANSCNLDPEVKKLVFSTIEGALRSDGVECVISNGQDSSKFHLIDF
ncbi:hypothetical protein PoB_005675400 [Plakobranchus ocellatus]|uniref:Uncharacterized protein n=1 Tax=Plakobranchus ocellatus TaxID=259542 RepID=A0AAV4CGF2_9GAST|nr:hypothetical protein PoB_005675400 [Plakobranchus ocellatus]